MTRDAALGLIPVVGGVVAYKNQKYLNKRNREEKEKLEKGNFKK